MSPSGTLLPRANAASCPHLAYADIRVLKEESGFDPLRSFTPDNIDSVRSMGHQRAPSVPFAIKNKIAD
jgi:hypothetical protein